VYRFSTKGCSQDVCHYARHAAASASACIRVSGTRCQTSHTRLWRRPQEPGLERSCASRDARAFRAETAEMLDKVPRMEFIHLIAEEGSQLSCRHARGAVPSCRFEAPKFSRALRTPVQSVRQTNESETRLSNFQRYCSAGNSARTAQDACCESSVSSRSRRRCPP
jgi:hypothetical protein